MSAKNEPEDYENHEASEPGGGSASDAPEWHGWKQAARAQQRWWREMQGDEPDQQAADRRQQWSERVAKHKPGWWPENEPWPPVRRPWRTRARRPFFQRLGCLFLLFNPIVFIIIVILVLNALGITSISFHQPQWALPVMAVLLALLVASAVAGAMSLRRMSAPLDDLLGAARRVAEGDYSTRVRVHGPTEVRSLASAFNAMAEQLDAHDRQRRSMLADVTHELRTPLTVIQGNLEGMLDGVYPTDETRLRSILEETQILSRLTDDLRTLSQAESGTLQLRREQVDLAALVRDTIAAFRSQADAGGVHIEFTEPASPIMLNVDPERVRQVVSNLISNAVRYSPKGSAVRVVLTNEGTGARISVADSGPGIAAADLPHVFDRYYKSADSRGMGLGLSIAKYIVEAHGGQIHAESQPGQGTTIWFTLPA
jgi:signal transduction histidine kinase